MNNDIKVIIEKIKKSIIKNNNDSLFEIEEEIEKLKNIDNLDNNVLNKLLLLYEENPNFDFGIPGALTHFLESFYKNGYEEKLIDSIRRKPTKHTLWMLNRIINGTSSEKIKNMYIKELENVSKNDTLDMSLRDLATQYIALHKD